MTASTGPEYRKDDVGERKPKREEEERNLYPGHGVKAGRLKNLRQDDQGGKYVEEFFIHVCPSCG